MSMRLVSGAVALGLLVFGTVALLIRGPLAYEFGRSIVGIAGVVALLLTIRSAKTDWSTQRSETVPRETESLVGVPVPGDDIDRMVRLATLPMPYLREQHMLHRRVVTLVRTALVVYGAYNAEEATTAIEEGTWIDDTLVTQYLSGRSPRRTTWQLFRQRLGPELDRELAVRRTLEAVAKIVPGARFEVSDGRSRRPLGDLSSGVAHADGGTIETQHWRGVGVVALAGIGVGIALANAGLLLAGSIGLGYTAYARIGAAPALNLAVDREFSATAPTPGDVVEVTVTVRNAGDNLLADLRIVDQLPDGVRVVDGTARRSVVLPPDGSTTLRYDIEASTGTHRFDGIRVIARSVNGSYERSDIVAEDVELTCTPDPNPVHADVPLRTAAARYVGQLPTDIGGEGIEFQAVREYRPGDRLSRIDWSRFARTEQLTTIDFREEKAATIVLIIDARREAYLAPGPNSLHAVQRSIDATDRLVTTLLDAGHRVGLSSMSPTGSCWRSPNAARTVGDELRELLTTHDSLDPTPPTGQFRPFGWVEWFAARAPHGAQVVLFSPLCDQLVEESIIRIEARGHPVTIVSPDPTTGGSLGREMARLDRQLTIDALRRRGIRVVDWPHDEPIEMSLERLASGGST